MTEKEESTLEARIAAALAAEKEESTLEARIAAALAADDITERDAREIRRLAELER